MKIALTPGSSGLIGNESVHSNYQHFNTDIRHYDELEKVFQTYGKDIVLIVHTAAKPGHDQAARKPITF